LPVASAEPVRILFLARHFAALRNYEQVIARLAGRGHQIHLAAIKDDTLGGTRLVERLRSELPGVTWGMAPDRESDADFPVRGHVRFAYDYLRYQTSEYAEAPRLRLRARERTPRGVVSYVDGAIGRTALGRGLARRFLRQLEASLPPVAAVDDWILEHAPDVMLFTPLIALGSSELDFLTSARRHGIFSVFCVWSWDNLSSKALIRTVPDATMVWNEVQRQEALTLHGLPAERVAVTGAQNFDHWFERQPTLERGAFAARVGLRDASPFLLWVCSALFRGADPEAPFVRRWVEAVRAAADPQLRDIPILIRPHPSRLKEWRDVRLDDLPGVAFWGANPIDPQSQADYFDSLYHATGVVGLNTSAFLEAAIVGRPVYALLLPEFYEHQEGTLQFPYLLNVEGGLLHAARTLDAHLEQLSDLIRHPEQAHARSDRFVRAFLRPHGLDIAASDVFVDELERRVALGAAPAERLPTLAPVLQRLFASLVRRRESPWARRWLLSDKEAGIYEKRRKRDREWRDNKRRAAAIAKAEGKQP
jgi:hypothetical protein